MNILDILASRMMRPGAEFKKAPMPGEGHGNTDPFAGRRIRMKKIRRRIADATRKINRHTKGHSIKKSWKK